MFFLPMYMFVNVASFQKPPEHFAQNVPKPPNNFTQTSPKPPQNLPKASQNVAKA